MKIGFGLLGAGLIAPFHAKALQASELTRLVAVADLDAARVEKMTAQFGCAGYSSLDAMLADSGGGGGLCDYSEPPAP